MLVIQGRNVNDIFPVGLMHLNQRGEFRDSRNGPTLEIMEPVSVTYTRPEERVLFCPERDANPFFHLFESLWMLAGRNDVAFLDQFNSQMRQYSDDGKVFNAPYGYRLREHFGFDQLDEVICRLRSDKDDRRAVLQLHDVNDLKKNSLDNACNLVLIPRIRHNCLDMTIMNRSNDYVYGMLGANAVHMSIIQEYLASMIHVPIGNYTQISNCLHAYTENKVWLRVKDLPIPVYDPYNAGAVQHYPLVTDTNWWHRDLVTWMENPLTDKWTYVNGFFKDVAQPMAVAHKAHKENKDGLKYVGAIKATDWRLACIQWLERREEQNECK